MNGKSPSTDQIPWSPIEVFQVDITPTQAASYSENDVGRRHTKTIRIGTAARNYAKQYADGLKRSIQYYNQVRAAPNLFTIAIGVWKTIHRGSKLITEDGDVYKGDNLDYEALFDFLQNGVKGKNYDPLRMVREKHTEIERIMEHAVIRLYSSGADGARLNRSVFKSALERVAEEYFNKVKNYVEGGEAPKLSEKTVNYFRPMKGVNTDTPLVSSGQLLNALTYKVYVEQTPEFRHHAELMASELKKANAVSVNRKAYESAAKKFRARSGYEKTGSSLVDGLTAIVEGRRSVKAKKSELDKVLEEAALPIKSRAKSKTSGSARMITCTFANGLLKDITLKYRSGSPSYLSIVEQNAKQAQRLANIWTEFVKGRNDALAKSKAMNDIGPFNEWISFERKHGRYPDEKTEKLMLAAIEFLETHGGESK